MNNAPIILINETLDKRATKETSWLIDKGKFDPKKIFVLGAYSSETFPYVYE